MLGYFLTNEGQDTRISGAQPERRLCWKGEYRRNRKERERERYAEERVCDRERERSDLEFCFGTTGRDLKRPPRSEVISVI